MTRKETLAELIAKVEAGEPSPHYIWQRSLGMHYSLGYRAAGGSLDAAKALHEAVLPRWSWAMDQTEKDMKAHCQIWWFQGGKRSKSHVGQPLANPCPARAWLLAILRALHSMEPDA